MIEMVKMTTYQNTLIGYHNKDIIGTEWLRIVPVIVEILIDGLDHGPTWTTFQYDRYDMSCGK